MLSFHVSYLVIIRFILVFFLYRHLSVTMVQFTFSSARLITIATLPFKEEEQTALFKRPSSYREVNTFHLGYKNQSVTFCGVEVAVYSELNTKLINTVRAESTYNYWMLNLSVHHVTSSL